MDVADVMTRDVLAVSVDDSAREAARMMVEGGFSGVPVVSDDRLVGVLSEADYLARVGSRSWISRVLLGEESEPFDGDETVGDLMTDSPITIAQTATVNDAARTMIRKGVKRLPVLDHGSVLVGIVTRADLIRSYVRPDDEVLGDIRALVAVLPAPMSEVYVEVFDGVALLSGDVETSAEARALIRIVQGIEGVVSVRNEMDWDVATQMGDNPYSGYPLEGAEVYNSK